MTTKTTEERLQELELAVSQLTDITRRLTIALDKLQRDHAVFKGTTSYGGSPGR